VPARLPKYFLQRDDCEPDFLRLDQQTKAPLVSMLLARGLVLRPRHFFVELLQPIICGYSARIRCC
jgi:hypothetical protein